MSSAIAVTRFDDDNVGIVLGTDTAELGDLIGSVLTPALAATELET